MGKYLCIEIVACSHGVARAIPQPTCIAVSSPADGRLREKHDDPRRRDPWGGPELLQKRLTIWTMSLRRHALSSWIHDKDEPPGYGAFWGEVAVTNVHRRWAASYRDHARTPILSSGAKAFTSCRFDRTIPPYVRLARSAYPYHS